MNTLTWIHCVHTVRACDQRALVTCSSAHSRYYIITYDAPPYARPEGSVCQSPNHKRL
jgi:hypothetical protein